MDGPTVTVLLRGFQDQWIEHVARMRACIRHCAGIFLKTFLTASATVLDTLNNPRVPYHTSVLTGEGWVLELLSGHPERIRCELGVHRHVFIALISEFREMGYKDSRHVSLEEQLAIFLYTCVTGLSIKHVGERFQRSNETISRYFRKVLLIFSSPPFYTKYVHLPTSVDPVPPEIQNNPKFWPFFKDALGALDGSHIHSSVPALERASSRNRKGFISQNCLFACSFDLRFVYALTGWEGSASDARVFEDALSKGLVIPEGKYYLADAGYPARKEVLIPYRGVRYHLAEWGRANVRPKNKEELFNLRHASARNAIERIFGIVKKRFRILLLAPRYNLQIQARIPCALSCLHNVIQTLDPQEKYLPDPDGDDCIDDTSTSTGAGDEDSEVIEPQLISKNARREHIAQAMWDSYVSLCQDRGIGIGEQGDPEDDENDDELDLVYGNTQE